MVDSLCRQRALRVDGLPPALVGKVHEQQLRTFFEELVGPEEVLSAKIILDYGQAYTLIRKKNRIWENLERARKRNMRSSVRETTRHGICCCKSVVDAESEYSRQLEQVQREEESLRFSESQKTSIGCAFVIFRNPERAFEARHMMRVGVHPVSLRYSHMHPENWRVSRAPPPSDIVWKNMGLGTFQRVLRFFTLNFALLFLTALTVIPITILNELKNVVIIIHKRIPIGNSSWWESFLSSYYPSLLLCANNSLIVPLLIYLVAKFERNERRSHFEKSILLKNFLFMLFATIILPSFGLTTICALFEQHNWYSYSPEAEIGSATCRQRWCWPRPSC
ncbi:MAG: hypothetical protein P4M11_14220 [Candidatus Pacebacteria bacterium]|nr:hypothetical protein [Candidatus Paceibacterota bacterium]